MSERAGMVRSGVVLTVGSIASTLFSFARNVLIARLISVEDFGIAAAFAMTMSLVEMTSNIALDRLLVQAPDGDDERLQACAQCFQAVRGLIGAAVLFAASGLVAALFRIPEVAWAFRLLAFVPLIRGMAHLDMFRLQRRMHFGASVSADLLPQVIATALAVPLALWLGDYRVMLWVVLVQAGIWTLASHLFAKRRYAWVWEGALIRRMLGFGWPLLINGLLMFGIFQGDRVIVGSLLGMDQLGWFSAAFALSLLPSMILARVLQSYLMPLLTQVQGRDELFDSRASMVLQLCLLAGVMLAVGGWVAGGALIGLVYGTRYADAGEVMGWLCLMQGVRLAKAGPAIVAMSLADTRNPMYANLFRLLGLIGAVGVAVAGQGLVAIAICGLVGEVLALVASFWMLESRTGRDVAQSVRSAIACAAAIGLIVIASSVLNISNKWIDLLFGGLGSILIPIALLPLCPSVLNAVRTHHKHFLVRNLFNRDSALDSVP